MTLGWLVSQASAAVVWKLNPVTKESGGTRFLTAINLHSCASAELSAQDTDLFEAYGLPLGMRPTDSPGPDPGANRFLDYACRGLCMHSLSHSESSGNHSVKIYAQCMNYRISAKILNSLST